MYSTLRKGLKCVFNYSVLSIVKSHSNSGKGGGVSTRSNSPPSPSQRFRGRMVGCCEHSAYSVLGFKILHAQGSQSTWNGGAWIYHPYVNFKSNTSDNSQSHGNLSLI